MNRCPPAKGCAVSEPANLRGRRPAKTGPLVSGGRVQFVDTAEAVEEFRDTAEAIGRKPADCAREALRDWTAKTRAVYDLGKYALFLLLACFSPAAFAFDVPETDLSKKLFLDKLFPELTGAGGVSQLAAPIGAFNSAVLIVAGILVFYTLLAGTLSTAHDGELLGKKWSSMWIPIRTTLGAAAIMPTFGGFSLVQAMVIWLALQGVGIANQVWGAFADNPMAGAAYVPPSEIKRLERTAGSLFLIHVCRVGMNEDGKLTTDLSPVGLRPLVVNMKPVETSSKVGFEAISDSGFSCGRAMFDKPTGKEFPATDNTAAFARSLIDPNALSKQVFPTHVAALNALNARMSALAEAYAKSRYDNNGFGNSALVAPEIKAAAQAYSDAIRASVNAQVGTLQDAGFSQAMKQDGWMVTGAWFVKLAHSQDAIASATSRSAEIAVQDNMGRYAHAQLLWAEASQAVQDVEAPGVGQVGSPRSNELIDKLLGWVMEAGRGVDPDGMSGHPLVATKNTGEMMKSWGIGIYTVGSIALTAAGVIAGNVYGKGLGSDISLMVVVDLLTGPFFAVVGPLVLMGAVLSSVIPMIPYVLWIGVVLGWMVLVVEAVIASPLWAVAHLAPDGDGVVGRGGQGYMLVLSLTLRPALMVLGFICAVAILVPIGELLNSTFAAVFRMSVMQDNASWGGFINVVMGLAIYSVLMITVMTKVFALIHTIPDSVLRWIGGSADNVLGSNAQPLAGAVEGQSTAMLGAGVAAGAVTQKLGSQIGQMAKESAANKHRQEETAERQQQVDFGNLERARGDAWNAEEKQERGGGTAAGSERAAHAQAKHGEAALTAAGHMNPEFGAALGEARGQGPEAVNRLMAEHANSGEGAEPYQRLVSEAQGAFGKAQGHMAATEAHQAAAAAKAAGGALMGGTPSGGASGGSGSGSSGGNGLERATAQIQALDSGSGPHYANSSDAIDAACQADPEFAQGYKDAVANGQGEAFVGQAKEWAGVRAGQVRNKVANGDEKALPLRASDAVLLRAGQDGVL